MDMFDLASTLFGGRGKPVAQGSTLTATGSAASEDGTAYLVMDADVTPAEGVDGDTDQTVIDVPTSPSVAEGDEVIMTLVGDGPLKTPVVMANPGFGDRQQAQITNAVTLATAAEAIASATGQHFWDDGNGAHVTQVTRDEWEDSSDPNYQSGPNSLWNSFGMLFRDGLTNLLAVLTSGIAIYDGNGNNADNIVAEFSSSKVRVGGKVPENDVAGASVVFFDSDETEGSLINASAVNTESASDQDIESNVYVVSRTNDSGSTFDTGSTGESSLTLDQKLWYGITDPGESHNEAEASLLANSTYNSNQASAEARVAAIATTTDASTLSYVELTADSLGIGPDSGSVTYVTMPQVLCALLHPCAMYTPSTGTWTTGIANAWETVGFTDILTESGNIRDYIDVTNRGYGEFTALVGCTVRVSACVTWVDSVAGRRSAGIFVNATRSGGKLTGGNEYSNSSMSYTGNNAKTAMVSPVILHLEAGHRLNVGKYAPASAIQSNQSYKMNWVTIEVLSVD